MRQPASLSGLFLILLSCLLTATLQAAPENDPKHITVQELKKIVPSLQSGAHIIYFRHMSTNHSREDKRPVDLTNCQSQRPLNDKGIQQAKMIGRVFRHLSIPISKVLSSPYCRCKDTARLAFGNFTVNHNLYFAMGLDRKGKNEKGSALKKLLGTHPAKGHNTIIVSHSANLQEATGLWPKPEGVSFIFKPEGKGQFSLIAKVRPGTWKQLLNQ